MLLQQYGPFKTRQSTWIFVLPPLKLSSQLSCRTNDEKQQPIPFTIDCKGKDKKGKDKKDKKLLANTLTKVRQSTKTQTIGLSYGETMETTWDKIKRPFISPECYDKQNLTQITHSQTKHIQFITTKAKCREFTNCLWSKRWKPWPLRSLWAWRSAVVRLHPFTHFSTKWRMMCTLRERYFPLKQLIHTN